jgi:hypothetical protein
LPLIFTQSRWLDWSRRTGRAEEVRVASVQVWIDLAFISQGMSASRTGTCEQPCALARDSKTCLTNPPPILVFEVQPGAKVVPSRRILIPGVLSVQQYGLRGVIYIGGYHFSARMLDCAGRIWSYDGQTNYGVPRLDPDCCSSDDVAHWTRLPVFGERRALLYIYGSERPPPDL